MTELFAQQDQTSTVPKWQTFLTIYAAIVATIAAGWPIYSYFSEVGELKVEVTGYKRPFEGKTIIVGLDIILTNIGRRPVLVTEWGIRKKENSGSLIGSSWDSTYGLPAKLQENDQHKIVYETNWKEHEVYFTKEDTQDIFFKDSKGNIIKVRPSEVNWLFRIKGTGGGGV